MKRTHEESNDSEMDFFYPETIIFANRIRAIEGNINQSLQTEALATFRKVRRKRTS